MERILSKTLLGGKFENLTRVRSRIMSAIPGRGNRSTEARFRSLLVREGFRGWNMHPEKVRGRPDFFFPADRLAIFVDGCFWHGCRRCGHFPRNNSIFWKTKIERNRRRDRLTTRRLQGNGIRVLRVWEHDLIEPNRVLGRLKAAFLRGPYSVRSSVEYPPSQSGLPERFRA